MSTSTRSQQPGCQCWLPAWQLIPRTVTIPVGWRPMPTPERGIFPAEGSPEVVFLGSQLQKPSRCHGDGSRPLAAFAASPRLRLLRHRSQQVKRCKECPSLLPGSVAAESLNICSGYMVFLIRAFYYFTLPLPGTPGFVSWPTGHFQVLFPSFQGFHPSPVSQTGSASPLPFPQHPHCLPRHASGLTKGSASLTQGDLAAAPSTFLVPAHPS